MERGGFSYGAKRLIMWREATYSNGGCRGAEPPAMPEGEWSNNNEEEWASLRFAGGIRPPATPGGVRVTVSS